MRPGRPKNRIPHKYLYDKHEEGVVKIIKVGNAEAEPKIKTIPKPDVSISGEEYQPESHPIKIDDNISSEELFVLDGFEDNIELFEQFP